MQLQINQCELGDMGEIGSHRQPRQFMNCRAVQAQAHALRLSIPVHEWLALQAPTTPQLFACARAGRLCEVALPGRQECIQLQVLMLLVQQDVEGRARAARGQQVSKVVLHLIFTEADIQGTDPVT
ncbi:hypothetical protein D3C78_1203610 [compost metagenome]